eukprot:TRINITY_DN91741_c0_g1_i1.p1 TRINITY_DN91741_c0_g1~~TRINITY_DN91741_c0_g1_i1.p1  ORF type:complete len:146 (+),score=45.69 TRINITY_DN91741_c0_g1_i1:149-586(+)
MSSYRASLRFCPICNMSNWMMGKNEKLELVYKCKVCGYLDVLAMDDPAEGEEPKKMEELCIFRHDVLFVAKESIIVNPDVVFDPTLPRVYDYTCHACAHNEAVFYRLAEAIISDAMAIIFVCCKCTHWRTEGKEVQYSEVAARKD